MKNRFLSVLVPLIGFAIVAQQPASAKDVVPAAQVPATPEIAGWNEFVDSLRGLPQSLLAKLPEAMKKDPQMQQEIGRLVLEGLATSVVDAISADGDHPIFLPFANYTFNAGQPNADTIYRVAKLTPGGTYRLRGQRGSLRIATIGQSPERLPGKINVYHDINALHVDAQGNFDVILSPSRPEGYTGDWWQLDPGTVRLLLRMVNGNWGVERDLTISIERVDKPARLPRRTAEDLEQRLKTLAADMAYAASVQYEHVEKLRSEGYINKLKVLDASFFAQLGGLSGQMYYEGAYDLRDDEALILEMKKPAKCQYGSTILTTGIYETVNWFDNHSSLNDSQVKVDKDGVLRMVVANKDPGVPNWLDTAGYQQGSIQGRWANCSEQPVPKATKVALKDLRKVLPKDTPTITPAQREEEVRTRRSLYQQRPIW